MLQYLRLSFVIFPLLTLCCAWASDTQASSAIIRRSQLLMGTVVQITAVGPSDELASRAASVAFAEIRRLEGLLSTWIPTSELSQVNAAAGMKPIRVSPESLTVLLWSLAIAQWTEGAFNIAIGPAVAAWSMTDEPRIPNEVELARLKPLLDLTHVSIDEQAGTVFLTEPGMRIDVGGIGKGYAADRAVAAMKAAGATAGVVALSGDIKTFGEMPDGRPFLFGIRHPRIEGALLARVDIRDEAISTAGDYERFFEKDGVNYHHILDPHTLQPARACQSVTVVARHGVVADGLDTGIFVLGPERGIELVERLPDVDAVIVDHEGKVWISSGLRGRVHMEPSVLDSSPHRSTSDAR
jgi:thiamine biosynthesis lipoprotein